MKKINVMMQVWALMLLICAGGFMSLSAQYYKVGDLYTFEDGSQGIVFYVDPGNPRHGWVAALQDLDSTYAIWTTQCPASLRNAYEESPFNADLQTWSYYGEENTRKLKSSGNSPAADALDLDQGWYIPDALQMRMLYGQLPTLSKCFEEAGGSISTLYEETHWTSSRKSYDSYDLRVMTCLTDGGIGADPGTHSWAVRPVRDFYDWPVAYWEEEPVNEWMVVRPDTTTDYHALILYHADTLLISNTVTVFESYHKDTLREQAFVSEEEYQSTESPYFTGLDVSTPGEYVYYHWESTKNGCDSVITLFLQVKEKDPHINPPCETIRDTITHAVQISQLIDNQITVASVHFEGIVSPGEYSASDTLTAVNGCDSIVVALLTVWPCTIDFSVVCPPDVFNTLAYGDCAVTVDPEQFGVPEVMCEQEWPFIITNDIQEDSLFSEGEHVVKWVVTDSVCGVRDSCEQRVVVVFPQCPDAVDCEGNVYPGVRIGCDCWTQRNLESTKYSDCADILQTYAYKSWQYPDSEANVAIFGRLYSYESAVRNGSDNGYGHIQGICPEGWYLPAPEQYLALNEYGADALKSPNYWLDGGGDNSTGFTALPAGRYNGERNRYEGLMTETHFWSTESVVNGDRVRSAVLFQDCDSVKLSQLFDGQGYSVRCIKERE